MVVDLTINEQSPQMELDTGASILLISESLSVLLSLGGSLSLLYGLLTLAVKVLKSLKNTNINNYMKHPY